MTRRLFLAAIAGAAGIGFSVLVGWMLGIPSLRSVIPGAVEMKANTAVGLVLSAAALFALGANQARRHPRTGVALAGLVAALGASTLGEYTFDWNLGIDELLFRDTGKAFNAIRGRMSPFSAVSFLGMGLAICVLPVRRLFPVTIVGGLSVLSIGVASLLGYLWKAQELTTDRWLPPVALNTAVAFILLGSAAMLAVRMGRQAHVRAFTAVESRVLAGFVGAVVLLFAIGWYTYWIEARFVESAQRVNRTQEVRGALGSLYNAVSEAESAQRNFLLTGNADHKRAYREGLAKIDVRLRGMATLITADPDQIENYGELRRLIGVRTEVLSRHLDLFERTNLDEVRAAIERDHGLEVMQAIQRLVEAMDAQEGKILARHEFDLARTRELTLVAIFALLGIATAIMVLLFTGIRRETTRRLRADEEAQRAIAAKESFLAMMSHEIRTPVNGMLGMLELLGLSSLDERQHELLSAARDSGSGLMRIIDDVLDHAKISAGKLQIHREPASIPALAQRVVRTYLAVASAKELVLDASVDAAIGPWLLADAHRIAQVLGNFVSNAIKFTPAGSVHLRVERVPGGDEDRETIRFSVRDTGIGIDVPAQRRLFQPFEQAATETSRVYGGTGLGLAISRRLAEMMGGTIDMQSAPGEGTTMNLTLTLVTCEPPSERAVEPIGPLPPCHATADGKIATVLAVDDHPTNRHLLGSQLAALGIQAVTASSGSEALDAWRGGGIDVVITDCNMPGMDGYALARAIRAEEALRGARVPIVAWTASVLADSMERCREAGMDETLAKPSDIAQLRQALSRWIAIPATRPEAVLDPAALAGFARDEAERAEILAEFIAQMKSDLSAFDTALAAGDLGQCQQTAHRMKGAARLVGARDLATRCEAIEQASHQDARDVARSRPALDAAFAHLLRYADSIATGSHHDHR